MKAIAIYNPAAGQRDDHGRAGRRAGLSGGPWLGRVAGGHAGAWRHDHLRPRRPWQAGADAVVVVGGDGSINEAVQALAGSPTALAVLPSGTGNVWAREVGIPVNDLPAARARTMVHGQVRTVDLGMAGDRYFLMWAGIGFDAIAGGGPGGDRAGSEAAPGDGRLSCCAAPPWP